METEQDQIKKLTREIEALHLLLDQKDELIKQLHSQITTPKPDQYYTPSVFSQPHVWDLGPIYSTANPGSVTTIISVPETKRDSNEPVFIPTVWSEPKVSK